MYLGRNVMKPINAITEYIRINVLPVISFFSASVAAYNFYKIWQRDASTFIWVIAIVSGIVLIIVFGVIGFSKKEIESSIPMNAPTEGMRFPKLYKYARIAFVDSTAKRVLDPPQNSKSLI